MSDSRTAIASVAEQTREIQAGAPVVGAHFLGTAVAFVLGEESLLIVPRDGPPRAVAVHAGAILSSAADEQRVVTGGDDGQVKATTVHGVSAPVAQDARRRWIDHVAMGPSGATAWSAGKQAFVRLQAGQERVIEAPSTVGGLAFAPKGLRLAIAHYNGVTLWFPNAQSEPPQLSWKGSHLGVAFSSDGRFLVTTMQEPTLQGWRLADGKTMRMPGYRTRVRSYDFSADGKWLATSGATELILWPFQGREGPIGKAPRLLAPGECPVEVVACHPKDPVVAAGYGDGLVLLVRLEDGAEILVRQPAAVPVTALAWSSKGDALAFGMEDGAAGIVDLS
jgi:WD40 repeat protein